MIMELGRTSRTDFSAIEGGPLEFGGNKKGKVEEILVVVKESLGELDRWDG